MLREVAYASLPKRERVRLHLAIVDGIRDAKHEHEHVTYAADHLERAAMASLDLAPDDRTIPERAVDALAAAGDRSRRRMESRSAVDFYQRALALAGPDDAWGTREARMLSGIGEARYWLSEYAAGIEVLDRAVAIDPDDAWTVALALRFRGDIALNYEGDLNLAASCSNGRSPLPSDSATRSRSIGPFCSPGGCRGRATTTKRPTACGSAPSCSPRSTATRGRARGR